MPVGMPEEEAELSLRLCASLQVPLQSQLVFKGATARSEPNVELDPNMSIPHSETHGIGRDLASTPCLFSLGRRHGF